MSKAAYNTGTASGSDVHVAKQDFCQTLFCLRDYNNAWFDRGQSKYVEALWVFISILFVQCKLPGSAHRRFLLRLFGAKIGERVAIKPGLRVKFPWKLSIGCDSWIGEDAWIDNLDYVTIGDSCCLSQGAYVCTGSHNWKSQAFDLITKPVVLRECSWIAARASVAPGVVVGEGAILSMGSVATGDMEPWSVYQGVPARLLRRRTIHNKTNLAGGKAGEHPDFE